MMWCNYLQGDLFERFYSNNLLTTSDIMCGILFNCALCALTQRKSMRCVWRMQQKLHISKIICICMTIHRLVSLLYCVFLTQLGKQSLFVLLFMVFSRPKLYCAELSLTIGCHGDTQQLGFMACWKGLAQELHLPCAAFLPLSLSDHTLPITLW